MVSSETTIIVTLAILLAGAGLIIYDLSRSKSSSQQACPYVGPYSPLATPLLKDVQNIVVEHESPPSTTTPPQAPHHKVVNVVSERDYRVLSDPLYPPINRQNVENTYRMMNEPRLIPESRSSDTYRLVGYLVNTEDKKDSWKLFARQSEGSRRSYADFYAEPSSRDVQGIKIPLSVDNITTPRLYDLYDLPTSVTIRHPMFNHSQPYTVVALPMTQFSTGYY
jgi:hypothetical protein